MTVPRIVTELGTERYCARCDEWWPEDNEFWVIQVFPPGRVAYARARPYIRKSVSTSFVCRACRRERQAIAARIRRRVASTSNRESRRQRSNPPGSMAT